MPAVTKPVIVQSDRSVLLEVQNPLYEEARDALAIQNQNMQMILIRLENH